MLRKDKVLKINYKKGKIDVSKVLDLEYFETYAGINGELKNYLDKYRKEIGNGNLGLKNVKKLWNDDFELKVRDCLDNMDIEDVYPSNLSKYKTLLKCTCDKSFSFAVFEHNAIDIVGVVALTMSITKEEDISKVMNSKEFEIILTMITLYLDYIEAYMNSKQENIKEFLLKKKIYGEGLPSDFDGLSVIAWKLFRDHNALNYACNQIALRHKKVAKDTRDTLMALYLTVCMGQLNRLAF